MTRKLFAYSAVVLVFLLVSRWEQRPIEHPPGVLVAELPLQVDLPASDFRMDEFALTRMAGFEIRARVLSRKNYYLGRESDLSPLDLALGWGVMSDEAILARIDISQGARWYKTRYQYPAPVSDSQIILNSSNMHMIPANRRVKKALKKLRQGEVVRLRGYLVNVDHDSGWFWRTSLRRDDTGAGACEIVYVESVVVES